MPHLSTEFMTPEEVIVAPGTSEPVLIVRKESGDGPLLADLWQVWLEPTAQDHAIGLCVGTGVTRALAMADTVRTLHALALEAQLRMHHP